MDFELVDAVDDNDCVVGTFERAVASNLGCALRVSGVLIFSSRSTVFLQRRSIKKKYPQCYDYSAAGHVLSGEDYLTAANRELEEELGIKALLSHVGIVRVTTETGRLKKIHHVFTARHDGPFQIYREEVEDVHEFSFDAMAETIAKFPQLFTPSFHIVFKELISSSYFEV